MTNVFCSYAGMSIIHLAGLSCRLRNTRWKSQFSKPRLLSRSGAAVSAAPKLKEVHMKHFKTVCSTFVLLPALAFISSQARAEYKCDAPEHRLDRAACEKAAESPQALRHYIQRMRPIESLQFSDYVNESRARAWAQDRSNRAPAGTAPVRTAVSFPENPGA